MTNYISDQQMTDMVFQSTKKLLSEVEIHNFGKYAEDLPLDVMEFLSDYEWYVGGWIHIQNEIENEREEQDAWEKERQRIAADPALNSVLDDFPL